MRCLSKPELYKSFTISFDLQIGVSFTDGSNHPAGGPNCRRGPLLLPRGKIFFLYSAPPIKMFRGRPPCLAFGALPHHHQRVMLSLGPSHHQPAQRAGCESGRREKGLLSPCSCRMVRLCSIRLHWPPAAVGLDAARLAPLAACLDLSRRGSGTS